MPLFKRRDDDDWTTERMSDGTLFRWRVRMERIDNIREDYREFLEATARDEGQAVEQYVEWVARLSTERLRQTRERIMSGRASQREATLYDCWLHVRLVLHEVEYMW